MKLIARRPAVVVAGLAAVLGLASAGGPVAGAASPDRAAPAGSAGRATPASAPPTAKSRAMLSGSSQSRIVRQDMGGSELASPAVVVHYPATGAVPLPKVPASADVLADADTGQVHAAQDAPGPVPPGQPPHG